MAAALVVAVGVSTLATDSPAEAGADRAPKFFGCERAPRSEVIEGEALVSAIEDRMDGVYVGWQVAVAKNCRPVAYTAGGFADLERGEAMTNFHRLPIGSVAKLVTSVAVMHELEVQGKSAQSSINPYMEMFWDLDTVGYSTDLTWAELMNQTSGLWSNAGSGTTSLLSYGEIDEFLATAQKGSPYKYDNTNAGLLKFLLEGLSYNFAVGLGDAEDVEYHAASHYQGYVQTQMFDKIGLDTTCYGSTFGGALVAKVYADADSPGKVFGKATSMERCSAGGWYMSSLELLGFGVHLRHSDKFVSQSALAEMDNELLGWETVTDAWPPPSVLSADTVRFKGGSATAQTCLVDFRDGTEVAIVGSSNETENAAWLCNMVIEEFDKLQ